MMAAVLQANRELAEESNGSVPRAMPLVPRVPAQLAMLPKYRPCASIKERFPSIPEGILLLNHCFAEYGVARVEH